MQAYRAILADVTFHERLWLLDCAIADGESGEPCAHPECSGFLHIADFPRKPRGVDRSADAFYEVRLSFCCSKCRRRATPRSVRFLDRRVFVAAAVVLIGIAAQGLTARRVARLREILPIDRRTLDRWREWWTDSFPTTPFWRAARARFAGRVADEALPASLLACFEGSLAEQLFSLLRFFSPFPSPLTT